jgi:hypothetical protein
MSALRKGEKVSVNGVSIFSPFQTGHPGLSLTGLVPNTIRDPTDESVGYCLSSLPGWGLCRPVGRPSLISAPPFRVGARQNPMTSSSSAGCSGVKAVVLISYFSCVVLMTTDLAHSHCLAQPLENSGFHFGKLRGA